MTFLYYLIFALLVFVALLLILLILIQKGRGGGLSGAFGGGGGGSTAFGAKTGDVLTWATSCFFGVFILLAVILDLVVNSKYPTAAPVTGNKTVMNTGPANTAPPGPTPTPIVAPTSIPTTAAGMPTTVAGVSTTQMGGFSTTAPSTGNPFTLTPGTLLNPTGPVVSPDAPKAVVPHPIQLEPTTNPSPLLPFDPLAKPATANPLDLQPAHKPSLLDLSPTPTTKP
jgi:preprotein translocase subunit SecG